MLRFLALRNRFVRSCGAVFLLTAAVGLAFPRQAESQTARPARMERVGPISPEKRAELRRQLEGHATLLESQSTVVKIVAKLVGPAVVYIESDVVNPPARKSGRQIEEAGSGVIVELGKKFYVLTNRHVIQGSRPDGIKISLADGRRVYPQKVWDDGESDVAIMLVDAPDLVPATIGDSDRVETGDFVLAVGSPFGLTHSVTFGIISAKGRRDLRFGEATVRFQDFLQTDAAINPGNSGGPLVNLRGEIIGMNTAIASNTGRNEGIGFAIPINMFMYVARQLVEKGTVTRAYIGVSLNARFGPAMAAELGLPALMGSQITAVAKGSPAEAARLAVGDIVLRYNDVAIEDDAHLVNLVSVTDVGAKIPLLVYRDRQTFVTEIVPTERVVSP